MVIDAVKGDRRLDEAQLNVLLLGLSRYFRARFRTLGRDDVVDLVNDAIARYVEAIRVGHVDVEQKPGAYLTRIAERLGLDHVRSRQRAERYEKEAAADLEELRAEDLNVEPLLNALASREMILQLMRRVRDEGQHELNELIRVWLDLAEGGRTPTLRELGDELEVSHTEVRRRLDRLAAMIDEETS